MSDTILFSIKFKRPYYEDLVKKAEASGLDKSSYIKLLVAKVDMRAFVEGRTVRDKRIWAKRYKQEAEGLSIAEGHALKALSGLYDPILAVNEMFLYNRGMVRSLIRQYCDKYEIDPEEFVFTKTIAKVLIKGYFEIEDIVERRKGYTRGRYRLKPE